MLDALISDWNALKDASAVMSAGPAPAWPWRDHRDAFLAQRAKRDRVQGVGMRFAARWNAAAAEIRDVVAADPVLFREFHVAPKKGDLPDPTSYGQAQAIMPRLIALRG